MCSIKEFEKEIDKQVNCFLEEIMHTCREGFEHDKVTNKDYESGFPVLGLASKNYYKNKWQEAILEWRVRESLVDKLFCFLFKSHGYQIINPTKGLNNSIDGLRTKEHEENFPVAFFIIKDGICIAYRYTPFLKDYSISENLPKDFWMRCKLRNIEKIDKWYYIDWSRDEKEIIGEEVCLGGTEDFLNRITLQELFLEYFSEQEYKLFLKKLKSAISVANQMLGFQTIHRLLPDYVALFKGQVLDQLIGIETLKFKEVNNQGMISSTDKIIPFKNEDLEKINYNFYNNRRSALVGRKKFAESFIMSEYLFEIFGEEATLDYTSVVCGYIKSVEQLYEMIIFDIIPRRNLNLYYPAAWLQKKDIQKLTDWGELRNDNGKYSVLMKVGNEKYFSDKLTMEKMISFLDKNKDVLFSISEDSTKVQIVECLKNFTQFDRNGYFHKHNIPDVTIAKRIRNNTLVIHYWLLGAVILPENSDEELLGIINDSFDKLFKKIACRTGYKYLIDTGDGILRKIVRIRAHSNYTFDKHGSLKGAELKFVEVDDYPKNRQEYLLVSDKTNVIIISENNLPKTLWMINKDGKRQKVFHLGKVIAEE